MESNSIPNTPSAISQSDSMKGSQGNPSNFGRAIGIKKPADMNGGKKVTKRKKQRLPEEEEMLLDESETKNERLFGEIDVIYLSKLNEVVQEAQLKLKSVVANLALTSARMEEYSLHLADELCVEHEELDRQEQSSQMFQSKYLEASETFSARELMTSEMVSETPGEQPRMVKKLVNFQDLSLAKIREVVNQQRNILDSLLNSIREIVSKINPMEIGYLNIKGKQPLEELFTVIFELLYDEPPDKFVWKDFKMAILLREEGSADFLSRMANFNIKDVKKHLIEKVRKIKDSEELRGYLEDPKVGETLIDIADWLEFIFHGNQLSKELAAMEDLHTQSKHMVEVLERNGRKAMHAKNLKQQLIKEEETAQQFVGFIAEKVLLMRDNFQKSQLKLQNHILYQRELVAHILQQELLKNQVGEGEIETEENYSEIVFQNINLPKATKPSKNLQ